MAKNRITSQELEKRKTELCQKWYRLMEKRNEIGIAIAVKRAEEMGIDKEIERIEKEYNELVEDFDEHRVFGGLVDAETKRRKLKTPSNPEKA